MSKNKTKKWATKEVPFAARKELRIGNSISRILFPPQTQFITKVISTKFGNHSSEIFITENLMRSTRRHALAMLNASLFDLASRRV